MAHMRLSAPGLQSPTTRRLLAVVLLGGAAAFGQPCDGITHFASGIVPTAELFVATDGSDAEGDGSATHPFASIGRAAQEAAPGTAIRVRPGTYPGGDFIERLHGTAAAPIWIGGVPGAERPVISGGSEGLHFIRARYVVVHDLEVRGAASNGINCDDGGDYDDPNATRFMVFSNLDIHDIGGSGNQDGLKLSGLDDFWVLDCTFARCGGGGSGSGIDHVGCHDGLIARCSFEDMSGNAVQCKGGSENLEIRWSRLTDAGERGVNIGGSTGFEYFRPPLRMDQPNVEARDIRVMANVIRGCTTPFAFVGAVDCRAASNTIDTPERWLFRILQETTSSDGYEFLECANNTVENNLFRFDRGVLSTYVNIGPNTAPETFSFANNLWYAYDDPGASEPDLPADEIDGVYGLDPLLADPAGRDYGIPKDSPAAGAGRAPAGAPADIVGLCYGEPPSIGAREVGCAGDIDGDGDVDLSDLSTLLADFGTTGDSAADLDGDGDVDLADLSRLLAAFGADCG